jgi:hypothetical protein
MIKQLRYLLAFTSSQLVCSLIALSSIGSTLPISMYLFAFLPTVVLIAAFFLFQVNKLWINIGAYLVLIGCTVAFWANDTLSVHISFDPYSFAVIVFLIVTIIFTITFPTLKPNSLMGIRLPVAFEFPEVWKRAHKANSVFLAWTILPQTLLIFYLNGTFRFAVSHILLMITLIWGVVYTIIIGTPYENAKKNQLKKELDDQIKKEEGYR